MRKGQFYQVETSGKSLAPLLRRVAQPTPVLMGNGIEWVEKLRDVPVVT